MAKFWMNEKRETKNDNGFEFDLDIDNDYYGNIDGANNSFDTNSIYGNEFGTVSDVQVVIPEEEEEEVLYKVLYAPEDCECRGDIVESLMAGRVVVVNLSDMDRENILRMFDYVMGALQVLGGELKRYNKKVVALFPAGVDVETPLDEIEDEPYEEDYEEELDD